jgi:hypothetical protein
MVTSFVLWGIALTVLSTKKCGGGAFLKRLESSMGGIPSLADTKKKDGKHG